MGKAVVSIVSITMRDRVEKFGAFGVKVSRPRSAHRGRIIIVSIRVTVAHMPLPPPVTTIYDPFENEDAPGPGLSKIEAGTRFHLVL